MEKCRLANAQIKLSLARVNLTCHVSQNLRFERFLLLFQEVLFSHMNNLRLNAALADSCDEGGTHWSVHRAGWAGIATTATASTVSTDFLRPNFHVTLLNELSVLTLFEGCNPL